MDNPLFWPEVTFRSSNKIPILMGHVFQLSDDPNDKVNVSFNAEQIWAPDSEICDHPSLGRDIKKDIILWSGHSEEGFDIKREIVLASHPKLTLLVRLGIFDRVSELRLSETTSLGRTSDRRTLPREVVSKEQNESGDLSGFFFYVSRTQKNQPEIIEKFEIFRTQDPHLRPTTPPANGFRLVHNGKVFEYSDDRLIDLENAIRTSELSKILNLRGFFR